MDQGEKVFLSYLNWANKKSYKQLTVTDFFDGVGFKPNHQNTFSGKKLRWWFKHEHLLTNNEIFWWVGSFIFMFYGVWNDKWLATFTRYDRIDDQFNKRLIWCNPTSSEGVSGGIYTDTDESDFNKFANYFKKIKDDESIIVYRGFKVRKGEAVRMGVRKLDNPDALQQIEGSGSSYTMLRSMAGSHLWGSLNPFFLEQYGGVKSVRDRNVRYGRILPRSIPAWQKRNLIMGNAYSCIGTYRVKKKDIIMVKTGVMEEVVCDPQSAKLQRYDFLSWADCCGLEETHLFRGRLNTQNNEILRSFQIDEKSLIRHFIRFQKQFYDHPELLKIHFKNENLVRRELNDHYQKFYESVTVKHNGEVSCDYDWKQGLQKKKKMVDMVSSTKTSGILMDQLSDLWG